MQSLLALPFIQVCLHEGPSPVLELQWLRYAASAEVREALTQVLRLTREHHVTAWVADDRLQGAIRPRDVEWAEQEILLPLNNTSFARLAHLESLDMLNRRTVDMAYTRTVPQLSFEVRRFEDIAQARTWASGGG